MSGWHMALLAALAFNIMAGIWSVWQAIKSASAANRIEREMREARKPISNPMGVTNDRDDQHDLGVVGWREPPDCRRVHLLPQEERQAAMALTFLAYVGAAIIGVLMLALVWAAFEVIGRFIDWLVNS